MTAFQRVSKASNFDNDEILRVLFIDYFYEQNLRSKVN